MYSSKVNLHLQIASIFLACSMPVYAGVSCSDLEYGTAKYQENMEILAAAAHLEGNYFNRYHEELVSAVCKGDSSAAQKLINIGSVSSKDAQAIVQVLGVKPVAPVEGSVADRNYAYAREKMSQLGLSEALSDNVAMYFAYKPSSECGAISKKALNGDQSSIALLLSSPSFCVWNYK